MQVSDGVIKNNLIREALEYTDLYKESFINWLLNIKPVFPRFISEFYTSTYFRITEGLVSVFQNSRTIRRFFSRSFSNELIDIIK